MEKLTKNSRHLSAATKALLLTATLFGVAVASLAGAPAPPNHPVSTARAPAPSAVADYRDVIARSREWLLQKDRTKACQNLWRFLAKEPKTTVGYREGTKALEDLSEVFLSEQGQAAWSTAESLAEAKPREAIEPYETALKFEDGNLAALKGLARVRLALGECDKAEQIEKQAELIFPQSPEVRLLRLQVLDCAKNDEALELALATRDPELESVDRFVKTLQAKLYFRKKDVKRARVFLAQWEQSAPDYPEVSYWRWKLSTLGEQFDRPAAVRYTQACQNLTPRKRKAFRLDVELCKGKDAVDAYLKSAGLQPSTQSVQPPSGGALRE